MTPRPQLVIVGASGGVGRAIVDAFKQDDVDLFLTANRGYDALLARSKRLADEGAKRHPRVFRAELAEAQGGARLADAILKTLADEQQTDAPRLDGLVVASGIDLMTSESKALEFDARLERAWRIDVAATIQIARKLGAAMKASRRAYGEAQPRPSVALFGWDGVDRGQEGETAQIYAACKGAIVAFARSLAQELAPDVRVNAVSPGWIQTTWGAVASERATKRVVEESLSERWGRAEEVAEVVRFLLSDASSYVNGQNIVLNGGFSYRRRT